MSSNCACMYKKLCLRNSILQATYSQGPSTSQTMEQIKINRAFCLFPFSLLHTLPWLTWHEELTRHGGGTSSMFPPHQVSSQHGNLSALQASYGISHGKILIESEMELKNLHVTRRCVLQCESVFSWSFPCSTLRSSVIIQKWTLFFKCKMKHIDCIPGRENWGSKVNGVCGLHMS